MKLIIQNDRIAATATDEYQSTRTEQAVIDAPPDFDVTRIGDYVYANERIAIAVPQKVTRRQGRQALLLAGKLDQVPLAIGAIEDETERRLAQIEWEDAQEYERYRPLVVLMGAALDLDLDALFIHADTL